MKQVNVDSWKQTEYLELPSGAVVQVTKRNLQTLLMAGIMPMELLAAVQKMDKKAAQDMGGEGAETLKKYLRIILENCIASPKIVMSDAPGPDEISIADIPEDDLKAIVSYFNGARQRRPDGMVESFRFERPGADAGRDVPEVSPAAVSGGGSVVA